MIYIAQQLLNTALSLLLLVQGNPNVDYYSQQYAISVANNAISYATQVINQGGTVPGAPTVSTVKIPYITKYWPNSGYTKFGCDDMIVYGTKTIAPTTAPLNAAYRELFNNRSLWVQESSLSQYWRSEYGGYGVYNVIGRLYNLNFERATIENGVAHIYLKGDFSGLSGTCDDPRPQAQIEAVAKQFSNIYSVEIHLSN